jgi:threonine dehydratase
MAGVGTAVKSLKPDAKVWGAEPVTASPAAASFAAGSPQEFKAWKASFVDGAGGRSMFPRMWERLEPLLEGSIVVTLEETRAAMRLLAEKSRVVAEGAAAVAVAAAIKRHDAPGPVIAVVSGGNVDLPKFCELIGPGAI